MLRTIGLMSGTSLDGVDAAYLETDGEVIGRLGPRLTLPYDPKLRRQLRGLLDRAETLAENDPELIDAVRRLTDRLAAGLMERNYRLASPRDGAQWSGIVSFASPRHTSEEILARLDQGGVSVSLREGLIRVSPHFYNTEGEIDGFLKELAMSS